MFASTKENNAKDIKEIKQAANSLKADAREKAYEVKEDISDIANRTGRKVREIIDTASDEIQHAGDAVGNQIRKNPVQSTLVALGAGFLLGAFFRR